MANLPENSLAPSNQTSKLMPSLSLAEVVVFLSGSAALIYEMVWHRYLTILMGAQATATSTILGVFLTGLGLGYVLFGEIADRIPGKCIKVFCCVELAIGVWGVCFPFFYSGAFEGMSALYGYFGIDSRFLDLVVASVLILPQSILMGATLPLLTAGLGTDNSNSSRVHARIYGFNTAGAFVGAIAGTFVAIPFLGLRHSLLIAAAQNIGAALLAQRFFREKVTEVKSQPVANANQKNVRLDWMLLLLASFSSGYFILSLENIIVRLFSLSVGPNDYIFGTVVAAFVLGLGSGGIRASEYRVVTWSRLATNCLMTLFLFLLFISTVGWWPYAHHLYRIIFRSSAENYGVYQTGLVLIALGVSFVPAFVSGFTLPFIFSISEGVCAGVGRRVGWIYSANTLGCLIGALIGGHLLLNYIDLVDCVRVGGGIVLLIGAALLLRSWRTEDGSSRAGAIGQFAIMGFSVYLLMFIPNPNPNYFFQAYRLSQPVSGSYSGREEFTKTLTKNLNVLFHKNGPDSTISVVAYTDPNKGRSGLSVLVNGKSDGDTVGDRFTMEMTAHLPSLLAESVSDSLVIGLGTGLTVDALRLHPSVNRIDVVDISETLLNARDVLDPYNGNISEDSRVHYYNMDALRLLKGTTRKYHLVVSEPSNPWMAGVENLYSREYYELVRSHLRPNGMLAQWLQAYDFDPKLFRMILRTLNDVFPFVTVWQLRDYDLLILASDRPLSILNAEHAQTVVRNSPKVRERLSALGLTSLESILALQVMTEKVSRDLADGAYLHTLERPRLGTGAKQAQFAGKNVSARDLARTSSSHFWGDGDYLLSRYTGGAIVTEAALNSVIQMSCWNELSLSPALCRSAMSLARLNYRDSLKISAPEGLMSKRDLGMIDAFRSLSSGEIESSEAFLYYQQNSSPLFRLPSQPVITAIERCLRTVDVRTSAYGECLLRRAAMFEMIQPTSIDFFSSMENYKAWANRYGSATPRVVSQRVN